MTEARIAKIHSVVSNRQQGIVVFEDIHDPHNAEAVLRSADAFGFQKVYFVFENEKKFNPRKIGKASSSSANKWLDFRIFSSTQECLESLKSQKYELYATVVSNTSKSLFETEFTSPRVAILFGNEHRGLSENAIKESTHHISIPMQGMVESLNLSVTAALFMYEITRQRRKLGIESFHLPTREQQALISDFLEK